MIVKKAIADYAGPRRDAEVLLLHCLNRDDRAWLFAHDTDEIPEEQFAVFKRLCARRDAGEPLAYLTGYREFWSLNLKVTPDVLIPRPETEYLVEWAIEIADQCNAGALLDLGTGSGAVALACKFACPSLHVTATDISIDALSVATENASHLKLDIEFKTSSWFSSMDERTWQIIVSNPPYIACNDPHLEKGDLRYEPRGALTDELDGLDHIRAIIADAPRHLDPGGWLLIEHGYDQAAAVAGLMEACGFRNVALRCDIAGRPRITGGCWLV